MNTNTPTDIFPDGVRVDVGGFGLQAYEMGDHPGGPTVVFETGSGGVAAHWLRVQTRVAHEAKTISYDRSGLGRSDRSSAERTLETFADELERLLRGIDALPPFVLVGHSMGGLLIRAFAARRPDDVAGLVLVDATHEQRAALFALQSRRDRITYAFRRSWLLALWRMQEALYPIRPVREWVIDRHKRKRPPDFAPMEWEGLIDATAAGCPFPAMRAEFEWVERLGDEPLPVPDDFGDLPLVTLTAGDGIGANEPMEEHHRNNQRALAAMSSVGVHEIVHGANHGSIIHNPDAVDQVATAILRIVRTVREGTAPYVED
ncbi:MAG: alpha/beta fold hydrolase [Actinomycetota bacterium]